MLKKMLFTAGLCIALLPTGCRQKGEIPQPAANSEVANEEPVPDFQTPSFPALALHLVYREFIDKNPDITTVAQLTQSDYPSYLESRLIELYPETAYGGMYAESAGEYNSFMNEYQDWLDANEADGGSEDPEPVNLPTLASETDYLGMTGEEIDYWNYLENLVHGREVTRSEIDSLLAAANNERVADGGLTIAAISAAIVITAYTAWRVLEARSRAQSMTAQFYNASGAGTKGDAFRHIYVSMHLRRYLTQPAASIIMFTYEQIKVNPCRDRYMDYHNNKIGRDTRYGTFRWGNGAGANDWGQWAQNVRNFVNTNSNASFQGSWKNDNTAPNNCSNISNLEQDISNALYIYYTQ